jgi:hypothetical protein
LKRRAAVFASGGFASRGGLTLTVIPTGGSAVAPTCRAAVSHHPFFVISNGGGAGNKCVGLV